MAFPRRPIRLRSVAAGRAGAYEDLMRTREGAWGEWRGKGKQTFIYVLANSVWWWLDVCRLMCGMSDIKWVEL